MATEKLYWEDPRLLAFEATVVAVDAPAHTVVLHASAFYPESGGQLGDHGSIGALAVIDTQIDDEGRILHHLPPGTTPAALPEPGDLVRCQIDAARRIEHLTLHSGQHLLSRALLDVAKANTVSSRLGESAATIDVDIENLGWDRLREVEAYANRIIDEDRVVRARFPSPEELGNMKLRRTPKVVDNIRVVEIEGVDFTPCGGTHARHTSEIGLLRILEAQRYKGGTRITFASGPRARRILAEESDLLRGLAKRFTCAPADVGAAIDNIESKLKLSREGLGAARAQLASALAASLGSERDRSTAEPFEAHIPGLDRDSLSALADALALGSHAVALTTDIQGGRHVIVARGPESDFDCGAWLKQAAAERGGRGGGRPPRAEGRFSA